MGMRSLASAALQCRGTSASVLSARRLLISPQDEQEPSSCKIHYRQSVEVGFLSRCVVHVTRGGGGGRGGEGDPPIASLCARSCPDTGTSSRQHGCLHHDWERRDEEKELWKGGSEWVSVREAGSGVRLRSGFSETLLVLATSSGGIIQACRMLPIASQLFQSFYTHVTLKWSSENGFFREPLDLAGLMLVLKAPKN